MAWKFNPHTNRLDFFGSLGEILNEAWQQNETATRELLAAFAQVSTTPPSTPKLGTLWLDTTGLDGAAPSDPPSRGVLKVWSGSEWLVPDVVMRHETTGELYRLTVITDPDSSEAVLRLTKL